MSLLCPQSPFQAKIFNGFQNKQVTLNYPQTLEGRIDTFARKLSCYSKGQTTHFLGYNSIIMFDNYLSGNIGYKLCPVL